MPSLELPNFDWDSISINLASNYIEREEVTLKKSNS